jgi:hypothetical protein
MILPPEKSSMISSANNKLFQAAKYPFFQHLAGSYF